MRIPRIPRLLTALLLLSPCLAPVLAQDPQAAPSGRFDRLFLSFAEDAAVAETQWWEGQVELVDYDPVDATIGRLVVALQPLEDLEFGGRVGFGSTDAPGGFPDGSGATDLDLWAKLRLVGDADTHFAFGALATVPTGDDQAGLGFDSFGLQLFASLRQRIRGLTVAGNIGVRLNEDGQVFGVEIDGENSPFLAGAAIVPLSDTLSLIGEARIEGERFDGLDEDARLLGGVNWTVGDRGLVRAAVSLGLTDGAPDSQLIAGYAYTF